MTQPHNTTTSHDALDTPNVQDSNNNPEAVAKIREAWISSQVRRMLEGNGGKGPWNGAVDGDLENRRKLKYMCILFLLSLTPLRSSPLSNLSLSQLRSRQSEFTEYKTANVFCGTWNVNAKKVRVDDPS